MKLGLKSLSFTSLYFGLYLGLAAQGAAVDIRYDWVGDQPGYDSLTYRILARLYLPSQGPRASIPSDLTVCYQTAQKPRLDTSFLISQIQPDTYPDPGENLWPGARGTSGVLVGWQVPGQTCEAPYPYHLFLYEGYFSVPASPHGPVQLSVTAPSSFFDNFSKARALVARAMLRPHGPYSRNSSVRVIPQVRPRYNRRSAQDPPIDIRFWLDDPDGDSLLFQKGSLHYGHCDSSQMPLLYRGALSPSQPFPSHQAIQVNRSNGNLRAWPSQPGHYLLSWRIQEFPLDTVNPLWNTSGITERVLPLVIDSSFFQPPTSTLALRLPRSAPAMVDTSLGCGDSTIWVEASQVLDPSSLALDGSDFFLLGPMGPLPVLEAQLFKGRWVKLGLAGPLPNSDSLQLTVRMGSDTNLLSSLCGHMVSRDTLSLPVACDTGSLRIAAWPDEKGWSLYPNPARDWVQIQVKKPGGILAVYDALGHLRYRSKVLEEETHVLVDEWPSGYYCFSYRAQHGKLLVR